MIFEKIWEPLLCLCAAASIYSPCKKIQKSRIITKNILKNFQKKDEINQKKIYYYLWGNFKNQSH